MKKIYAMQLYTSTATIYLQFANEEQAEAAGLEISQAFGSNRKVQFDTINGKASFKMGAVDGYITAVNEGGHYGLVGSVGEDAQEESDPRESEEPKTEGGRGGATPTGGQTESKAEGKPDANTQANAPTKPAPAKQGAVTSKSNVLDELTK